MKKNGFTLVELLVAIAIFAILSALGWQTFDHITKIKNRNAIHEENLAQLQEAYQQMQRDSLQIIPVAANSAGQVQPALQLKDQVLMLSKTGVVDPLQQNLSSDERIEYRYNADDKKLYRLKYSHLNHTADVQPVSSVLLTQVDQLQFTVLNPTAMTQWPEAGSDPNAQAGLRKLPRGLSVKFTIQDVEYEWIFSLLNTDFISQWFDRSANDSGQSPIIASPHPVSLV